MPQASKAKKALQWTLAQLRKELDTPDLPKATRRSLLREYSRCTLSLSKLEQLQARLKLQDRKPLQPVQAPKREPKSIFAGWAESLDAEIASTRNILGGPEMRPAPPQHNVEPSDVSTVQETPPEPATDDSQDDYGGDSDEEDPDPSPVPQQVGEAKQAIRNPDPAVERFDGDHWLERQFCENAKRQRAEDLLRFYGPVPGLRPLDTPEVPSGEGRFSFSDSEPAKPSELYDPWLDSRLPKPQEPEF